MKLKLVVASMSILGLVSISCEASAATTTKHTYTHHKTHTQQTEHPDYKDMGNLPVVCTVSQNALTMDAMTHNLGRALPNPCSPRWFDRIQLSGAINVDLFKFGNRNSNFEGVNTQRFSLNDVYINVSADVTDWAKAFASISYSNPVTSNNIGGITAGAPGTFTPYRAQYSSTYTGLSTTNAGGTNLNLEQAYVTIANFDMSPFFLQIGKQFSDFSMYEIHPITLSMTQVLSEALATSIKGGFIVNGFNGSIYAYDDPIPKFNKSSNTTNYGIALGYARPCPTFGWDAGIGYVYNMIGAQNVADAVNYFDSSNGYHNRTGAAAVYADINAGPFTIGGRYTTAVSRFNPLDLPKNGVANTTLGVVNANASGAKPWAAGIQAGYGFDAWGKNQNVYLGYQASREAAGIALPKNRWLAGYGIAPIKSTNVGVEWDHDSNYSTANGGNGNDYNVVSVRTTVAFN